jgi:hypothetical protein
MQAVVGTNAIGWSVTMHLGGQVGAIKHMTTAAHLKPRQLPGFHQI